MIIILGPIQKEDGLSSTKIAKINIQMGLVTRKVVLGMEGSE